MTATLDIVDWLDAEGTPEAHAARDEIERLRLAVAEENRIYFCRNHAPEIGFATAKEPPWPFWKCAVCGNQAHGWVVRPNAEFTGGR